MTGLPRTVKLSIERKQMVCFAASHSPTEDGVYETLTADLDVQHFVVRNGERRNVSEGWALRYVCDEAGPDSKTRRKRDASVYRGRRRLRIEGLVERMGREVLRGTSGGLRICCELDGKPGTLPTAETRQVGVGNRGGWTIYQTRHLLTGSEKDFSNAFLALGSVIVDDMIVMSAGIVETVPGESATDPRRVWKLQCIRQAQSGAEAVERFMIDDVTDLIIAPTHRGVKSKMKALLAERERKVVEDARRLEREKASREAEARSEERRRQQATIDAMPKADLDALTGILV